MAELRWKAQYNDGSSLNQIDDNGTKHAYTDIERERLSVFYLQTVDGVNKVAVIFVGDGEKLVWTRRIRM